MNFHEFSWINGLVLLGKLKLERSVILGKSMVPVKIFSAILTKLFSAWLRYQCDPEKGVTMMCIYVE